MAKYRVFISYSHKNAAQASTVESILKDKGFTVLKDSGIPGGISFHEEIKTMIAHAHVFVPIITGKSLKRGWVQQEIGYAIALHVPILPVSLGPMPEGFAQLFQAAYLPKKKNAHNPRRILKKQLKKRVLKRLVEVDYQHSAPIYECARDNRERAEMFTRYSDRVRSMGYYGMVRQKGGLSSFHIPDLRPQHPEWLWRYGLENAEQPHRSKDAHYRRWLRQERRALEKHARRKGCKLIINPKLSYSGPTSQYARLRILRSFLESMPSGMCQVAIHENMNVDESTAILGDWYHAESVSGQLGQGYRQTIFTRHAPSVLQAVEEFDDEFNDHLHALGWRPNRSREAAIKELNGQAEALAKDVPEEIRRALPK